MGTTGTAPKVQRVRVKSEVSETRMPPQPGQRFANVGANLYVVGGTPRAHTSAPEAHSTFATEFRSEVSQGVGWVRETNN